MNEISGADKSINPVIRDLMTREPSAAEKDDDKNVFLKLMITQMENQDPLNPKEGADFLAQLAQFSTVEGIEKLNVTVDNMVGNLRSNQALQATALVGRSVQVDTGLGALQQDGLRGMVDLDVATSNLRVDIQDLGRQVIQQLHLGAMPAGRIPVFWDGYDSLGNPRAKGSYRVEAYAMVDGKAEQVPTLLDANVDSVTINKDGSVDLNVAGVGRIPLEEVKEIR